MDAGAEHYSRFLQGDMDAMAAIVMDYQDGLFAYLRTLVADDYIAEQLTDDTFFKLMDRKPGFSRQAAFKTWLYTIGRNLAWDHLRRAGRLAELTASPEAPDDRPERQVINGERDAMLFGAMARLRPRHAKLLYWLYFEQITNRQAAERLGKTPHQIEAMAYRARRALKNELEKEGFTYEEQ